MQNFDVLQVFDPPIVLNGQAIIYGGKGHACTKLEVPYVSSKNYTTKMLDFEEMFPKIGHFFIRYYQEVVPLISNSKKIVTHTNGFITAMEANTNEPLESMA
jgi:hypothetical protein